MTPRRPQVEGESLFNQVVTNRYRNFSPLTFTRSKQGSLVVRFLDETRLDARLILLPMSSVSIGGTPFSLKNGSVTGLS